MTLTLGLIVLIVGLTQSVFALAFIGFHRPAAWRGLVELIVVLSASLLGHLLFVTGYWEEYLASYLLLSGAVFLYGPVFYSYALALTGAFRWNIANLLHLLPFLIYVALAFMSLGSSDATTIAALEAGRESASLSLVPMAKIFLLAVYLFAAARGIKRHRDSVQNEFANTERYNLRWLLTLFALFTAIQIVFWVGAGLAQRFPSFWLSIDDLISIVLVVMIFAITAGSVYCAPTSDEVLKETVKSLTATSRDASSELNDDIKTTIAKGIRDSIEGQFFLDRFVSLSSWSSAIGVSKHHLSGYLNQVLGVSFYDFVNEQRIEFAKDRLINSQESILDIALESGFNNKATFNRQFKSLSGVTPSQFRQSHK